MTFLNTTSEKKSFLITTIVFLILLLVIFLYKFQTIEQNFLQQGGEIAIRFGQHNAGQTPKSEKERPAAPVETPSQPTETPKQPTPTKVVDKKVVTQDKVATKPIVAAEKVQKKEVRKPTNQPTNRTSTQTQTKPTQNTTRKPSNSALDNILAGRNSGSGNQAGTGDDGVPGNKGRIDGDPYANSYYGAGRGQGIGSGNSWGLSGRSLVSHNIFKADCNETGTVVIQVTVNKQGQVTNAKQVMSGTTNSAPCLVEPALKTARTFRWKADSNAPASQIGFVAITFRN